MAAGKTNVLGGGLEIKASANSGFTGSVGTATTKLSRTGKGILMSILGVDLVVGEIWVDGVLRTKFRTGQMSVTNLDLFIPYNTSLEIRTTTTNRFIAVFSDGSTDMSKGAPVIVKYGMPNTSLNVTTTMNVVGKGYITGILHNSITEGIRLLIDGNPTSVLNDRSSAYTLNAGLLRFNSSFQIESGTALALENQAYYLLES